MDDILTKFGFNSKTTIGVSISANNMIEMICIDKTSRSITQYAAREIKYNNAIREVVDYEEMSIALTEMFAELRLNPKNCKVILNVPNVHFSFIQLPLILPDDQITSAIESEVEQLYLFKRHTPIISWNEVSQNPDTDKRLIVYSAIQEAAMENILEVFNELGTKLVAIDSSHSSMLKGVQYSRIIEDEIRDGGSVNILLVTSNSYAIFCMSGNKVVDYYEEPLAIKSFTGDEVYLAISSAAGSTLEHYPTRNLLIISETNDVNAELLSSKISFDGAIKYLDRNQYTDKAFINIDFAVLQTYLPYITLESVGVATYNHEDYPIKFNFLANVEGAVEEDLTGPLAVNLFGQEFEVDRKAIVGILGAIIGVIVVIFLLIYLLLNSMNNKLAQDVDILNQQQQEYESKIKDSKISADVADIYTVSQNIYTANRHQISLFNALGADIPKEVWISTFGTNSDGKVIISGKSTSSEYIYAFFKGLKAADPDIYLSQLQLDDADSTSPIPDIKMGGMGNIYMFEIKSSKNKDKAAEPEGSESGAPGSSPDAKKGFSLFNSGSPSTVPPEMPPAPGPSVPPITSAPQ